MRQTAPERAADARQRRGNANRITDNLLSDTVTAPMRVSDTIIRDSTYQGVLLSGGRTISGVTFDNVTIDNTGTYGIAVDNVSGSATFSNTRVSGAASGGLSNPGSTFTVIRGAGNSGF